MHCGGCLWCSDAQRGGAVQPQALFRVAPVSRCSSSLAGHAEAVLSVAFSPNGECDYLICRLESREGLLLTPRHTHAC
jgi:hypothetical protein